MKSMLLLLLCLVILASTPAFAESHSVTLTDVPYSTAVPLDFQREFDNITRVELTLTSEIGAMSVCWEEWTGEWVDLPCGNLTQITLGGAYLAIDGLGTIDHQNFDLWSTGFPAEPVTDWSFLNGGTTTLSIRCWPDGCYADWVNGQGYCGPDGFQVYEATITIITDTVPVEPMGWDRIKALFR